MSYNFLGGKGWQEFEDGTQVLGANSAPASSLRDAHGDALLLSYSHTAPGDPDFSPSGGDGFLAPT